MFCLLLFYVVIYILLHFQLRGVFVMSFNGPVGVQIIFFLFLYKVCEFESKLHIPLTI